MGFAAALRLAAFRGLLLWLLLLLLLLHWSVRKEERACHGHVVAPVGRLHSAARRQQERAKRESGGVPAPPTEKKRHTEGTRARVRGIFPLMTCNQQPPYVEQGLEQRPARGLQLCGASLDPETLV